MNNADELFWLTDPLNPDSDGDGLGDGLDAHPKDPAIDWEKTRENSYIWIPINGEETTGHAPMDLNNRLAVLFSNMADWRGGGYVYQNGEWTPLNTEQDPAWPPTWEETFHCPHPSAIDDEGKVLGQSIWRSVHSWDSPNQPDWFDEAPILWTSPQSPAVVLGRDERAKPPEETSGEVWADELPVWGGANRPTSAFGPPGEVLALSLDGRQGLWQSCAIPADGTLRI